MMWIMSLKVTILLMGYTAFKVFFNFIYIIVVYIQSYDMVL